MRTFLTKYLFNITMMLLLRNVWRCINILIKFFNIWWKTGFYVFGISCLIGILKNALSHNKNADVIWISLTFAKSINSFLPQLTWFNHVFKASATGDTKFWGGKIETWHFGHVLACGVVLGDWSSLSLRHFLWKTSKQIKRMQSSSCNDCPHRVQFES